MMTRIAIASVLFIAATVTFTGAWILARRSFGGGTAQGATTMQSAPAWLGSDTPEFHDSFSTNAALREAARAEASANSYWWLQSGGMAEFRNGRARTLQETPAPHAEWRRVYAARHPADSDNGRHPQNIFRLVTRSHWQDSAQQIYARIIRYHPSASSNRNGSNGIYLLARYQDAQNFYSAGMRVDGTAAIVKTTDGVSSELARTALFAERAYDRQKNPQLLPKDTWIGLKARTLNRHDGGVTITLAVDIGATGNWTSVLQVVDDGKTFGGPPHAEFGAAGIRSDFMDAEFDNYAIARQRIE
ncbi:MAG: hypothetical protein Q8R13_03255 [bacterium]|nr:hypothetical protein [bacterium]MDZ4296120.1 hypothetical protein [Patescibacteria group bacterium]